jgi:DNA-binding MarR family transcriptional regulator
MKSTTGVPDLTAHLGYWLRQVSNHVSQAFARKLEGRGVTVAEWVVLRELHDAEALPPSQLADKLGLTRGAITKLADRLIDKSFVIRTADPSDGRAQTLSLTRQGRRLVPQLATLADENDIQFFSCLTVEEREGLMRLLKGIVAHHDFRTIPVD